MKQEWFSCNHREWGFAIVADVARSGREAVRGGTCLTGGESCQ